jgi:hypothetical protein
MRQPRPRSKEEARIWDLFDRARQETKQQRKQELAGEIVGADILNFRLKQRE